MSQSPNTRALGRELLIGLLLIGAAVALRWNALPREIWNVDEGSTFTMAQILREGGALYRDAADNRTPMSSFLMAGVFAVGGDWNLWAGHFAVALMVGGTAWLLRRIGRQAGETAVGTAAAVVFTLLSYVMLPALDGLAAHTGWFLAFFSALGIASFIRAFHAQSIRWAFVAGTWFAAGMLSKQPGLLDAGICVVVLLLAIRDQPSTWRDRSRLLAGLALGLLWPLLATWAYLSAQGAWEPFVRYALDYNTKIYMPEVPFAERWWSARMPFILLRDHAPVGLILGLLAALGLLRATLPTLRRREGGAFPLLNWIILGWCGTGLLSTALSGRDFPHYSIQLMPGLALACGWVVVRLWRMAADWPRYGRHLLATAFALGLVSLITTAVHRIVTLDASDTIGPNVGRLINEYTAPTERIFVWGYQPELHCHARRLPNTRFMYSVFLTGLVPWTNTDPLKNTDYAIVPGAWDDFWHDFERTPPALIADTGSIRGFLKYPLRRQERLWNEIERHYVEIEPGSAQTYGITLYRRTAAAPAAVSNLPAPNSALTITAPAHSRLNQTVPVVVTAPAGTRAVTLLLDGQPYREVATPVGRATTLHFFVLGTNLDEGTHVLQAFADGNQRLASRPLPLAIQQGGTDPTPPNGPSITFGAMQIPPLVSEAFGGKEVVQDPSGHWAAHAPSRLVYERPPEMTQLTVRFGINPLAYADDNTHPTDGVEVVAFFEDPQGKQTELYRRIVSPRGNLTDRGLLTAKISLPAMDPGKIILMITAGRMNDPAFDWAYWTELVGERLPIELEFRDGHLPLVARSIPMGLTVMPFAGREVVMVHAPSSLTFEQPPGLATLSGEFGLLDSAWSGPKKSVGAVFEVLQVGPDEQVHTLFSRTLYPAQQPADRGVHAFTAQVPAMPGAQLRFVIRPANPADNAFNHTFWHKLKGEGFVATIAAPGGEVRSLAATAPNGLSHVTEDRTEVLLAHAPSQLEFPLPAGVHWLKGDIGLISRAYTGEGDTDGVVFRVTVEETAGAGPRELFRRQLDPRRTSADRGAQPFAVALPAGTPLARLRLITEPVPGGRLNFTWSYWRELRLEP